MYDFYFSKSNFRNFNFNFNFKSNFMSKIEIFLNDFIYLLW